MPINAQIVNVDAVAARDHTTITLWNRLEVRPRKTDFTRSLKAEVRDPLWMLCRQWQWGEFKGEDTGSPVFVKFHNVTRKVTRLALGNDNAVVYDAALEEVPLETRVEHMPVIMDTALGLKIGRMWKKMLTSQSMQGYYSDYLDLYAFDIPAQDADSADFYTNSSAHQHQVAAAGRTIDGRRLIDHLGGLGQTASDGIPYTPGDDTILNDLGTDLMDWFNALYYEPLSDTNAAWNQNRLEYSFSASIPQEMPGSGSFVPHTYLVAKEYYSGQLSWHSMDILSGTPSQGGFTGNSTTAEIDTVTEKKSTVIPTGIVFPGMPADRWWEIEDNTVNLSGLNASSTDVAKIMLAEFGLVYAHEWNVIPLTVPVGSMSEIKSVVVTDTFGQRIVVKAAGQGEEQTWQRWNMFNLNSTGGTSDADLRLFVPPTTPRLQESEPIEKVHFFRDEMSNMVWGIEEIISDDLGRGRSGGLAATEKVKFLQSLADPQQAGMLANNSAPLANVHLKYDLSTSVPENWIPFVPVRPNASIVNTTFREIQLQRGRMPRFIERLTLPSAQAYIRPRTFLIGADLSQPLYVFEEEIPRSGTKVEYTYQRTRWYNGKTVLWAGIRKTNGSGEGTSGLLFDRLSGSFRNS